jgi:hypothetical protein
VRKQAACSQATTRSGLRDQDGMRAVGVAIAALAGNPYPPEGFHRGRYHRLRVGPTARRPRAPGWMFQLSVRSRLVR